MICSYSKVVPSDLGVKWSRMTPCGTDTNPNRVGCPAAALAPPEKAGTIASSHGRASVKPIPRKNARRGNDILVMNMISDLQPPASSLHPLVNPLCLAHLKRNALDDAEDYR